MAKVKKYCHKCETDVLIDFPDGKFSVVRPCPRCGNQIFLLSSETIQQGIDGIVPLNIPVADIQAPATSQTVVVPVGLRERQIRISHPKYNRMHHLTRILKKD
jgi:predicted  nucleic acid-binding Zn-ribbon protein